MTNFKNYFFRFSSPLTKLLSVQTFLNFSGQKVLLPFYHLVNDKIPQHLKYLYDVRNTKMFIADLDFLLRNFKPIDLKKLIEIAKNKTIPASPVFHLTFDDGLSEFHDIIAPILLSKGIPATCFLNSAFIDNNDLFYRYKESLLIDRLHREQTGSLIWRNFHEFCTDYNLPKTYYRKLILSFGYNQNDLLDKLAAKLGVSFKDYLAEQKPYMTSEQILSLISKGFTFGAHSIDHPDYRFLSEEEQIHQTKESIVHVTNLFNLDYKAFSFPFTDFGLKKSFFNKLRDENITDITFGCAGIKKDSVETHLQRIPVESFKEELKEIFMNEATYYLFSAIIRKHIVKRK